MMKKGLVGLVATLCFGLGAWAQTLVFAVGDWEPYIGETMSDYGPSSKIVTLAAERAGYSVEFEFMNWNRALTMAKKGKVVGTFPWQSTEERKETLYLSGEPVARSSDVYFYRKSAFPDGFGVKRMSDLAGQKVVAIRGYSSAERFKAAGVKTHIVSSAELAWKMIERGKMDVISEADLVGQMEMRKFAPSIVDQVGMSAPYQTVDMFILYPRIYPEIKTIMAAIDAEMKKMKESGEYDRIYRESVE